MRIAMVGVRGIPARIGGAERVVDELTHELTARGHEVLVYGRASYAAGAPGPSAGRCIVTPGLGGKHFEAITHTATALLDVPRRGVDVVHIHCPGPALLSWLAAACGKPIVLTIHAPDWQRDKWSAPAKWALRLGLHCGMRLADEVTAVSDTLARELSSQFGREVRHVPNAARPVEARRADAIARWGLKPDRYVLYVGRIVPEKRLDLLLEAWPHVGGDVPLVVAGHADSHAYGRLCRRLARRANVILPGPQYGNVLAELYSNAALVVQPSVLEGMSLVLLEAASYGRCVVACDIPANREVLGESAVYFPPDNGNELTRRICRCLESKRLRSAFGAAARDLVTARYSWAAAAKEMERLYMQASRKTRLRR